jgi:outer membrane protein assembly factor BamB
MKKIYKTIMLLLTLCFLFTLHVLAKRSTPEVISPIIYNDIKIVAENNSPANMGIIQAFDTKTNKLLWSKKVYNVVVNPLVEADTQWVFIKEMKVNDNKLIVINERGKVYTLDPNTGKILTRNNLRTATVIIILIILFLVFFAIRRKKKNN